MKNQNTLKFVALAAVAAVALFAGCSQQQEADGHDHAGHQHAAKDSSGTNTVKCVAHNDPKELCFICDPALRDKGRLWCQEHSRYEDRCWECHPEAQDKNRLYCKEHSLYEDECFICHPEVRQKGA